MSSVIAVVKSVIGQVIALTPEGAQRLLIEGDRLFTGEQLETGAAGMVSLQLTDGRILDLGRETQWSAAGPELQPTPQPASTEVGGLQQAIAAGADPTAALAPTAAGPEATQAGGGGGSSHSFVVLETTAGRLEATVGFATQGFAVSGGEQEAPDTDDSSTANFAPVFTLADATGLTLSAPEDTPLVGSFSAEDPNGDTLTFSLLDTPSNGTLSLSPSGDWGYSPNPNYNGLDSFQIAVSDGRGGVTSLTLTLDIAPVNDAPVAEAGSAAANEGDAVIGGQILASDVDQSVGSALTFSTTSTVPGLTFNADGSWSFDPSDAAYDSLAVGQQLVLEIPVSVTDDQGATGTTRLSITLTGSNDAPVAVASTASSGENAALNASVAPASDIDGSIAANGYALVSGVNQGSLSFNSDGSYSFDPGSDFDDLAEGESREVTFSYSATDNDGAVSAPASVTIRVTGSNDAPVATATSAATVEDGAVLSGQLAASDADNGAVLSFSLNAAAPAGFSLDGATGQWTFDPSDAAYQALADGEVQVIALPFTVTDEHGATSQSVLSLTVTGSNDAPVASVTTAAAVEDEIGIVNPGPVANATDGSAIVISIVTTDPNQAFSFDWQFSTGDYLPFNDFAFIQIDGQPVSLLSSVAGVGNGGNSGQQTLTHIFATPGTHQIVIGVSDATDTSVNSALAISNLPMDLVTSITSVGAASNLGGTWTLSSNGASNQELTNLLSPETVTGQLQASDIDHNAALTFSLPQAAPAGFNLNGNGSWTFDPSDAAYQSLAAGEQLLISVPFTVTDEQGASSQSVLTLTVTGTNDAPSVAAALATAANEDDASFSLDLLAGAGDVDNGAVLSVGNLNGLVDGLSLSGSTLTVDPTHAAFQDLAAGEERLITISYEVVDGQGGSVAQTASITLTGTNDAPVASLTSATAIEDYAVISGQLAASDVDNGAVLSFSLNTAAPAGFSLDSATGAWTFDPSDAAYQALAPGEVQEIDLPFTVTDEHGATSQSVLSLTVTGSNDSPVASAAMAAAVEDGILTPGPVANATDGSAIVISIVTTDPNQAFSFDWQFSTGDYLPFDDFAFIQIDGQPVALLSSVAGVGSGGNSGQQTLTHIFATPGTHQIVIGVSDAGDTSVNSALAISNLPMDLVTSITSVGAASNLGGTWTLSSNGANNQTLTNLLSPETVTGQLQASDIDHNAALTFSLPQAAPAGFNLNGNGSWTFDPSDAAYQSLAAGEQLLISVPFTVTDEQGASSQSLLSLTVTGTNDAPSVAAALTAAANEDAAGFSLDLLAGAGDVDNGAVLGVSNVSSLPAGLTLLGSTLTVDPAHAAFQHLAAGEEQQITVSYEVVDGNGGSVAQTASITLTGTNDAPTVAAALTAAANEDGASFSLDLLAGAGDVDNGAVLGVTNVSSLPAGVTLLGSILSVDPAHAAFQDLAEGEERLITVTYDVVDQHGASVAQSISITITGSNDVPTVTAALTAAANEDAAGFSLDLLAGAGDVDNGAVLGVTNVSSLPAGLTLLGSTLTVDPAHAAFQDLAAGEERLITVTYDLVDGNGGSVAQTASITITGSNDAPVASATSAAAVEDGALASGQLAASDADNGAVLSFSLDAAAPAGFSLDGATGAWSFDPSHAVYQALAAGEQLLIAIPFSVTDEQGATSQSVLSLTLTGANDAPTVAAALTAAAADEDDSSFSLDLLAGAGDVDNGAVLGVSNLSSLPAGVTLLGSTLTVDPAHAAFQHLAAGEEQQITVTYEVVDGQGGSTAQTATITLTGTNDAPTVAAALTAAADEDDTSLSLDLLAGAGDVDNGAVLSVSNVSSLPAGVTLLGSTLTVDPTHAAFQNLAAGEVQQITVTYDLVDGQGGSTAQTATITITGTNDAPSVAAALTAAADEDDASFSLDLLAGASDVDNGSALSVTNVSSLPAGLTLSGSTLTVDPAHAAFQTLAAGEEQQITVTYDVVDDKGSPVAQTLTLTVTGSNDAPVATATIAAAAEDGALATGQLAASDIDNGAALSFSLDSPAPAGFSLDGATGEWSFDPSHAVYQALATGEELQISVPFTVTDEHGASSQSVLSLTVTGTNDAAVLSSAAVSLSETDAPLSTGGVLSISDLDSPASFLAQTATPGSYGNFSIDTAGVWSYTANSAFDALNVGDSLSEIFSVSSADGTTTTVRVTINGTNDAPTTSAVALGSLAEDGSLSFSAADLLANAGDVDNASLSISNLSLASGNGSLVDNGDGTYSFTPAPNWSGAVSFSYSVTDGAASVAGGASLTVTAVNDAPLAVEASASTGENSPLSASVPAASDIDGSVAANGYALVGDVAAGSLSFNADGTYSFDPGSDFDDLGVGESREVSFSYSASDTAGAVSAPASVTITVTGSNDGPLASASTATTGENTVLSASVPAASDIDGSIVSYSLVSGVGANNGALTFNADGTYSFDPGTDFDALAVGESRVLSFSYSATDNDGAVSAPVSVTLTVTGTNDAPLMQASLGNAAGVIVKPQSQANHDFASAIDLDGSFVQVANADVLNSTTTPFVSITAVGNGAADYYAFTVTQAGSTAVFDIDHARTATGSGLDAVIHLWDANGTRLTFNDDAAITSGAGGSAHSYDSYLSYTFAQPGTYYISVGSFLAATTTSPNNPIAAGLGYQLQVSLSNALMGVTGSATERADGSANENSGNLSSSGVLAFGDVDLSDSHTLSAALQSASDSLNGAVSPRGTFSPLFSDSASGDGAGEISWTYTVAAGALDDLAAGQTLTQVYRVSVTDNSGAQSYRDVTITLTGSNDAPTGSDISVGLAEDSSRNLSAADFGFADVDASDSLRAVRIDSLPSAGALTLNGVAVSAGQVILAAQLGNLLFTPAANANGNNYASFSFSVQDQSGSFDGQPNTLTLNVSPLNDVPTTSDLSLNTNEDSSIGGAIVASDLDNDSLSYALGSGPANGGVTLNSDGSFIYSPAANFNGSDSFTVTVTDGQGGSATSTVSIGVAARNDAPVNTLPASYTINEDIALKLSGLAVTDVDAVSGSVSVTLAVASGTLTAANASGVTVTGSGSGSLVLSGTLADINAYLAAPATQPTYTPVADASGTVTLTMISNDLGNSGAGGALIDSDSISISINPVADAVPGSDASVVVGSPLTNSISFASASNLHGLSSYTFGNGITLTTGGNGTFNWSNGNDVGVNGSGDNGTTAQRIEGNEAIVFNFPYGMQYMALKLKNSADDTVQVRSVLEVGDLPANQTITGTITSSGGTVSSANLKVDLVLEVLNGGTTSSVTLAATVSSGGTWSVSYGGVSGTITKATVVSTIDGDLFNQGGNTSANVTYAISADMQSLAIAQDTSNTFSAGQNNNGFQIEYIAVDPSPSGLTSYSYPVDIYAVVQDTVGTLETFTGLTLSELPAGSSISVVRADGTYQEIAANAQGEYDLSAYTSLLSTATTTSGTDKIYLITDSALPAGFAPTLTLEVSDGGSSSAKTIIGGSADSTFTGGTGNDYISGGAGSDSVSGAAGNDRLEGGTGNDILIGDEGDDLLFGNANNDSLQGGSGGDSLWGGSGIDTFVWKSGDSGSDSIKDFNAAEGDRIDLSDLLQGEENSADLTQYLRVDTTTSTLEISSSGQLNAGGAADVSIKLENGGAPLDLSSYGGTSAQIVNSLIAGADPLVKTDHS